MDKIMLEEVSPTRTHSVPVSIYEQENEKNGNRELSFPKSLHILLLGDGNYKLLGNADKWWVIKSLLTK